MSGPTDVTDVTAGAPTEETEQAVAVGRSASFEVHLSVYEGPFDLLLQLISKHQLDITEVALSSVTDEFIAHVKALGDDADLEQTTEFLLVASTLLDLKAARLLPQAEVEDEEDLALLEARDLLFARLLQYRAFKQVADVLQARLSAEERRYPRSVGLDDRFAQLLPEVVVSIGPDDLAALAARAMTPRPEPVLSLAHLHAPQVSVREQAVVVADRLKASGTTTFRHLTADAPDALTRVARFLALLELFREGVIGFEQLTPLGELTIRWTGDADVEVDVGAEFDEDDLITTDTDPADEPADDSAHDVAEAPEEPR